MTHLEEKYDSVFLRVSAHDDPREEQDNSEIEISLPGSARQYSRVVGMQVVYVGIPHVFYNIPDDVKLIIEGTTTDVEKAVIPKGFYTVEELLETIKIIINDYAAFEFIDKFSYILNPINGMVSISIERDPLAPAADLFIWKANSIMKKLGFSTDIPIKSPGLNTFHASSMPKLSGPQQIFVCCPEISVDTSDVQAGMNRDVLVCVPVNAAFGETIHFTPNNDIDALHEFGTERAVNTIFLSLRDAFGNLIKIGNHDWTIFMKVYYIDN